MQRHRHGAQQVVAAAIKARVPQLAQLINQVARRQVRLCRGLQQCRPRDESRATRKMSDDR